MSGVNKAILVGYLGKDPETHHAQTGKTVVNLSVATSESWKDKQTGERQEKTEWHRVVMFGPVADIAETYLSKGSLVYLEGKIQTNKWEDNDGATRYTTEIVAHQMKMLGGKGDRKESLEPPEPRPPGDTVAGDDFDDQIPF